MFQPYMVIIRLAHKKENKHTVAFRIEISVLYISICVKYIHMKLDSLRNEDGKSCNVWVFKVVKRLVKKYNEILFGC
jgi:putative aminopeptidase FrvX